MNDSDLILNPNTNRFVKKSSQTGKRLLKELKTPPPAPPEPEPEPVQTALLEAGADIVLEHAPKFKGLSASETDNLFKQLLLERLSISKPKPKKKKTGRFRVVQSSSESDTD
jgi:hypothetical protein